MAPVTRRARRASAELPTDLLFDIFLQFSARELCRLRVVCRIWRSLTCDPHFIRAHTARHHQRDPLLVASFLSGPPEWRTTRIDLMDLSGKTVKRVASALDFGQVLCPRLGLVFVANKSDNTCYVLDPAAADARAPAVAPARFRLPVLPAPSHRGPGSRRRMREAATSFAFGRVATTGEHKVLRIFHRLADDDDCAQAKHLFESTVFDGVVYFLRNNAVYKGRAALPSAGGIVPPADCVASFDLEREEWRKRLQGPISMDMGYDDEPEVNFNHHFCEFALAELKGSLVLVHCWYMTHLWILTDFERGGWVKEYSIGFKSIRLLVLRSGHGRDFSRI